MSFMSVAASSPGIDAQALGLLLVGYDSTLAFHAVLPICLLSPNADAMLLGQRVHRA